MNSTDLPNDPPNDPPSDPLSDPLTIAAEKLAIARIERHLFLCADQTKPICCDKEVGLEAWNYLKRRIEELALSTKVFRTKANCLRICCRGPILVVYPDRVWYHSATEVVLERILQEHVIKNQIVNEFAFQVPLGTK